MTSQNRTAEEPTVQLYTTDDGQTSLEVRVDDAKVWLTYEQMAELFGRDRSVVFRHARNALREGEVSEESVVQNLHKTSSGRPEELANLDVIISVGYRVTSLRGVQFRRWDTGVLRQHLTQGYTVNQRRLDQLHQALRIAARSGDPQIAEVAAIVDQHAAGLFVHFLDHNGDSYSARRADSSKTYPLRYDLDHDRSKSAMGRGTRPVRLRHDTGRGTARRAGRSAAPAGWPRHPCQGVSGCLSLQ